jgi:hypothetical protein
MAGPMLVDSVIAESWSIQNGKKVYPLHLGTSDIEGIRLSLRENGFYIIYGVSGFYYCILLGVFLGVTLGLFISDALK